MAELTPEKLAQRLYNVGLLEPREIDAIFDELGSRDVTLSEFIGAALRSGKVTNWQIERAKGGHKVGYFYGPYKVLYLVGAGTFARVYRATNVETDEMKAVKVLRSRYTNDVTTTEQFLREAKMVITLRHENIVPIYEIEKERNRLYMVMDFVEGQNLRDYVKVHRKLKLDVALNIAIDICRGLDYAFKRGVTHRDLKLSNVLLASTGKATLVDFGLATIEGEENDADGVNPRSIDYAGLERATGVKRDDKRSDIYFLGCMLYHMVCGVAPLFETKERMQRLSVGRYKDVTPITNHDPNMPHRIVTVVHRAMAVNPADRFQTPGEMLAALESTRDAILGGDLERYDASKAESDIQKERKKPGREGMGYTVMLIETNAKLQNNLREKLKAVGYRVLVFTNPRRAIERIMNHDADFEGGPLMHCVIFGCGELGSEALEAFNYFGTESETAETPAVLLTNEEQQHFVDRAKLNGHRVHIEMPLKLRELRQKLMNVIHSKFKQSQSA